MILILEQAHNTATDETNSFSCVSKNDDLERFENANFFREEMNLIGQHFAIVSPDYS